MIAPSSAAMRIGTGQPFTLHGAPHVCRPPAAPGAVGISLGTTSDGRDVTITISSLEELIDLESVAREAFAQGIIQAGMRPVTA